MTDDERAMILSLADRVRRIQAHSRLRPHAFLEDKSEIAAELTQLAKRDGAPVIVSRDIAEAFGSQRRREVTSRRGRQVVVERRGKVA